MTKIHFAYYCIFQGILISIAYRNKSKLIYCGHDIKNDVNNFFFLIENKHLNNFVGIK